MSTSKRPDPKRGGRGAPGRSSRSGSGGGASPSARAASASLYERYKDALRRGHVAALRGRNDAAVDAYGEAASIAPDRALPHASMGGILVKMGRPDDAIAAYERALALAPRDEVALRGISETLARVGRRAEAATALDRLADALEGGGRLADATDAARRALELAESRDRRAHVEELAERLRTGTVADEGAERALSQALRVLESPVGSDDAVEPTPAREDEIAEPAIELPPDSGAALAVADAAEPEAIRATAGAAEPDAEPEAAAEPEPALEPVEPAAPDEVVEPAGLGIALGAAAEGHLYAGETEEAHAGLLAAARAHRRAGRLVAALDACDLAIGVAPADPDLHLLLAELYLDRGWRTLAADKLLLLGRIAALDGDNATRDRLCDLAGSRLADEPRLTELCA